MRLSLLLWVFLVPLAHAGDAVDPNSAFHGAQHIATKDGIDEAQFLHIGGIDQWVSVRGRHRSNPILLFLHGGPGFTSIPDSYYYLQGWDEYFTVVQWDQRGAGKTYLANDASALRVTMTIDRFVDDADELVALLRRTYGKARIVLLGHSWGTVIGVKLVQRHPDWFSAYVGIGQFVDFQRSESLGYQSTLAAARADHNDKAVAELEALAPFPDPKDRARNFKNLQRERHWLEHYDGDDRGVDISPFSPDYTAADLRARDEGMNFSLEVLWNEVSRVNFTAVRRLGCPVILLHGRRDVTTSATVLADWYKTLSAPAKKLVWFDDSAHLVIEEEPGKVLVTLVETVRPLAVAK